MTCGEGDLCMGYYSDTQGSYCEGWCEQCGVCYGDEECTLEGGCMDEVRWDNSDRQEVGEALGDAE